MSEKKALKGGEFLIRETDAADVFIPEEFDEEQKMMAQTCRDFTESRVLPAMDKLEEHDNELLTKLLKEAGELGLLGISVPEEYEGFGQKFVTSMLTVEEMGKGFSFAVAYSAHTGIGTLPILYFGNEEQKQRVNITDLINEYEKIEAQIQELTSRKQQIRNIIYGELVTQNIEEMSVITTTGTKFVLRIQKTKRERVDVKLLRAELGERAERFITVTETEFLLIRPAKKNFNELGGE